VGTAPVPRLRRVIQDGRPEAVRDEVDRLVEAWGRERPELDVAPMEVLSRVTRLARHLDRERSAAFAAHGLEIWEFDVLAALRRAGRSARLSPGQLIKETMVTSGTMTNRVDRLAARGLVLREGNPDDRRVVLVRLTDTGREAVDAALADLMEAERRILASLPVERYELLAAALRQLLIPYDDAAATSVNRVGGPRG
jgi:DNA-binding MarR family transcriptional regulator